MYLHTRIGRGLGLTTRVGPLAGFLLLLPAIVVDLAMVVYHVVVFLTFILAGLVLLFLWGWRTYRARHPPQSQRRALVQPLLAEAVTASSREVLKQRLETYGVYAVRHRFFSGPFPATGDRLAKLYPNEVADILIVGLFATPPAARMVSSSLKRMGFSAGELRRLFAVKRDARQVHREAPAVLGNLSSRRPQLLPRRLLDQAVPSPSQRALHDHLVAGAPRRP